MAKSRGPSAVIVVLLACATAAGGYFYWKSQNAPAPVFTTTTVTRSDLTQVITATGELQPVTTVEVSSQISGLVQAVLVDFNSPVKKGDVLAKIDPATYESRLRQAQAQLANTQANFDLVKLNADRARALRAQNLVSQQELDQAEAQLAQSQAQLQIQQASVENAKVDLDRCTLTSPIDGTVLDRQTDIGQTVAASLNAPTLFTLVNDLAKMQIVAAVAEADIGAVAEGQSATFTVDAFPSRTFRGRVAQIRNSPNTTNNVVTYSTLIDVRNDDLKLKPGMTANVSIVLAHREGVLKLPNSALRARIPEALLPASSQTKTSPSDAKPAREKSAGAGGGGGDSREQVRALMQEVGYTPGSGPPPPDIVAKIRELAKARGLELPERFGGGGRAVADASGAPVTRTLYKLGGSAAKPVVEPVSVKLGITDGTSTEILEGLAENDTVITTATIPGTPVAAPPTNPFSMGGGSGRPR